MSESEHPLRVPTKEEIGEILVRGRAIADQYDKEAFQFMAQMDQFILSNFGTRCPDFDKSCGTCQIWLVRDAFQKIAIF